ncbi:MAG TPA: hypothetical protein VGI66_18440 [Streptosporangiaceae bacterium]|jgi:hypothetical protein
MRLFARYSITLLVLALLTSLTASPASAAAAAPAAVSGLASAMHPVKVRVVGRDRAGHVTIQVSAVLLRWTGETYRTFGGQSVTVLPGSYLVGADVPTGTASQSLVVRRVTIRKNETITMDAAHGRLVRVTLTGVRAVQSAIAVSACLQNSGNDVIPATAGGGAGVKLYAVPFRSASVRFSYQAAWQGTGGVGYNAAGSAAGGIPARLGYRAAASHLAGLAIAVRAGVNPATSIRWSLTPGNFYQSLCSYGGVGGQVSEPFTTTQYVTPGLWTTNVETDYQIYPTGFNYLVSHFAAGHRYRLAFEAATAGPGTNFPDVNGNTLRYNATDLFDLPGIPLGGDQCCARSVVLVRIGGHVVDRARLDEWRGRSYFQKVLAKAGWYTFDLTGVRRNPHGSEPADMLSTRVTLSWRFHVTPVPPAGNPHEIPVTVTTYEPRGLSLDNQAAPGATTTVEFQVLRAGMTGDPAVKYALKSVRVLASFDGGRTWRSLLVSRRHGFWLTTVHDPASGYVTLRSVVTDVHGDRTTQTIYRAYAIG